MYIVKDIFYSLQGEGANVGRAVVFCRFAGCNLWTGKESDRKKAVCQFCDTDFTAEDIAEDGRFESAAQLADAILDLWPESDPALRMVVLTGGEPLLQVDAPLVNEMQERQFRIALETNGTRPCPEGIDWICVSPKGGTPCVIIAGNELKLVFPQSNAMPELYESLHFDHFFLQPMDGEQRLENTRKAIEYCKAHPKWRLSLQIHKILNIP